MKRRRNPNLPHGAFLLENKIDGHITHFTPMFLLYQWFKTIGPLGILIYAINVISQEILKIKKEMHRERLIQK